MKIKISKKFIDDKARDLAAKQVELRAELDRINEAREEHGRNDLFREEYKRVITEMTDIAKQCVEIIGLLEAIELVER